MKLKKLILALTAASLSSSFAFAQNCFVDVQMREHFRNPQHIGYKVANLGELLDQVEAQSGVRLRQAEILSLSLTIQAQGPLIIAWRDVSGYNQNSGAAISVRRGVGTYRVDDYSWRQMQISENGTVHPYDIDVNATGSGVVTQATLGLRVGARKCDEITSGQRYPDYEPLPDVRPYPLPDYEPLPDVRPIPPRRVPERRPLPDRRPIPPRPRPRL